MTTALSMHFSTQFCTFFPEDILVLKNAINKMRIIFQPLLDNNLRSAMT